MNTGQSQDLRNGSTPGVSVEAPILRAAPAPAPPSRPESPVEDDEESLDVDLICPEDMQDQSALSIREETRIMIGEAEQCVVGLEQIIPGLNECAQQNHFLSVILNNAVSLMSNLKESIGYKEESIIEGAQQALLYTRNLRELCLKAQEIIKDGKQILEEHYVLAAGLSSSMKAIKPEIRREIFAPDTNQSLELTRTMFNPEARSVLGVATSSRDAGINLSEKAERSNVLAKLEEITKSLHGVEAETVAREVKVTDTTLRSLEKDNKTFFMQYKKMACDVSFSYSPEERANIQKIFVNLPEEYRKYVMRSSY